MKNIKNAFFRNKQQGRNISKFNFFLNDLDSTKTEKLKKYVAEKNLHYKEMGNVEFHNQDYQNIKSAVLPALKSKRTKSFLFIDPYGYKDISIVDIEKFLESGNSEVLIFMPTQFMYRFEKGATPESLYKFMEELLPNEDWGNSKSGIDFIYKLRNAFGEKLKNRHYVDSFIITRNVNQYFAMFFFTSHKYGFEKFLEAKWKIDEEEGRGWSPILTSNNLFSLVENKPLTDKFEENLKLFISNKRTNIEIHDFTIENRHLIPHANSILVELQNKGLLNVDRIDKVKSRKNAFYLGWSDIKSNIPICYINLK